VAIKYFFIWIYKKIMKNIYFFKSGDNQKKKPKIESER